MPDVGVVIPTFNSGDQLDRCLQSLTWADEIIIIDGGSQDDTTDIAREYTEDIYEFESDNFSEIRNKGIMNAESSWLLHLDADEVVPRPLAEEIQSKIMGTDQSGFYIRRQHVFLGKELGEKRSPLRTPSHLKLAKRDQSKFVGNVHEELTVEGELGEMENVCKHYSHNSVEEYISKMNRYSSLLTREHTRKRGYDGSFPLLIGCTVSPVKRLVSIGIIRGYFFDGWHGLVYTLLVSMSCLVENMKIWESKIKDTNYES
ncbi:glycosyltransferase involved in cell wall biosynthesis [Haloarcula quadrata]|uniref:Glycosyltransferase involved in cell wall biosynthesis n=1 Tax=Haloarcula quadrata TaxID=182779 RepID=A0A495R7E1_9EURY|nr:glycosyltransferase family 2 protein [Haloarcula quadrata]RKS83221.1 glycosyltransferase involved in cell wall biosynthesis [Haloarcula quadrata]